LKLETSKTAKNVTGFSRRLCQDVAKSEVTMKAKDGRWYDAMYNNRELVPEHPAFFARWAAESARARAEGPCELDIAYGSSAGERLDVFPAPNPDAPVLVFVHGGYWRSLDKSDHSFIAPAFTRDGACVVVPNYDLCPAVTIPDITLQVARAVAWTWHHIGRFGGDRRRIVVAGHSAGGHLAAMMLACQWPQLDPALPRATLRGALAISGLHDLDPIMRTPFLQPALRLTPDQVAKASPARLPEPKHGVLYTVAGGAESAEYHRQNRLIQEAWGPRKVPVCELMPGLNHFSVLDALVEPSHRLHQLALDLLQP
jgi:arylformamidase